MEHGRTNPNLNSESATRPRSGLLAPVATHSYTFLQNDAGAEWLTGPDKPACNTAPDCRNCLGRGR